MVDAFQMHIMQTKELGTCLVRQIGGCLFFYMRISNVYFVIVVRSNANVACAFQLVFTIKKEKNLPAFIFQYL
jgi:AP-2 complex subunit mu-1